MVKGSGHENGRALEHQTVERFDHGCTGTDEKRMERSGSPGLFVFAMRKRKRGSAGLPGASSFFCHFAASASRMRTQERMPLWKDCSSYFSFGE
jgi:hypothetical protein